MEIARGKSKLNTILEGGSSEEGDCKWLRFGTVFGAIAAVAVVAALRILVRMVAGGRSRVTRAVEGGRKGYLEWSWELLVRSWRGSWAVLGGLGGSWNALGDVI